MSTPIYLTQNTAIDEPRHDLFPININFLLIFFTVITLIFIITTIACICLKKRAKLPGITALISGCILIAILISCQIAKPHGLYTTDITLYELYHGIDNTPIENKLPEDLSGAIILFYRFGCSDCEAIYHELSAYVKDVENIYWVSTRSEQGQPLISQYSIDTVPAGVYISRDTDDEVPVFVKKTLDTQSHDGTVSLDTNAIDRLLYLQEQKR